MPLSRGRAIGYDAERMSFEFTMMTPDARSIECSISNAALQALSGPRGALLDDREMQFAKSRDKIESVASQIYDAIGSDPVRVFRSMSKP